MADARYYNTMTRDLQQSGRHDRRRACRYRVALPDGVLRWQEGSSSLETPCQITNLSLTGCLIELRRGPRLKEQQSVWLRPAFVASDVWHEAVVVGVHKAWFQPCRIGIRFLADLPYDWFKPMVFGTNHPRSVTYREGPEHETDRFWK